MLAWPRRCFKNCAFFAYALRDSDKELEAKAVDLKRAYDYMQQYWPGWVKFANHCVQIAISRFVVFFQEQDGVTPEQRSILQSPLVQPNHDLLTPEQRSDLNSPMVYQKNETEWPSNVPESYYKAKDKQSER